MDLSGRIDEGSVFHSYHYYLAGLTEFGFPVLTGLVFKSQVLLGCAITTSAGAHFRHGKVERFHATIKGRGRTMMFDSGVSAQFWYYTVVHAVLSYNMLTMARNKNDQERGKTVWEV